MFRIETKKDIRIVARAQREGWDYDRKKVVAVLMEVVESRDPDLMFHAIERLQKGDEIAIKQQEADIKRELMELKKLGDEQQLKLRLIELARSIEPSELAKRLSQYSTAGGIGIVQSSADHAGQGCDAEATDS